MVEVWNDYGSTYAMAYPMKSLKPGQTFMLFGFIKGVHGDVVTPVGGPQRGALLQGHLGQHQARGQRRRLEAEHQLQGAALHLSRSSLVSSRRCVAAFGGACGHPRFR
ncbi:MAG: hypothetical protein MZU91_12305 [Desulfosudis oleivorans]|nr:hypothetical protein [Desulfosudis oleivorans]